VIITSTPGSADNIVSSLKEAGWLDYQVLPRLECFSKR
jgi:hypothetical protein